MAVISPIFEDEGFLDALVCLLARDIKALRECAALLTAKDFEPLRGTRHGRARWIVATQALSYYQKYQQPVGTMLQVEVLDHIHRIGLSDNQAGEIKEYCKHLKMVKTTSPDAITGKVLHYKSERLKAAALQEMTELHSTGQLTDEKWMEINQRVMAPVNGHHPVVDYLSGIEDRIHRRSVGIGETPWTFIDPLDSLVPGVGRKQVGIALAPYGRGKSLFLLWIAAAHIIQGLNVFYVTLEDPGTLVEDRLDAIVTKVPIANLADEVHTVNRRFAHWRSMVHKQLKIYDGTDGGATLMKIEQALLQERANGFLADTVIIDYDDEVVPSHKQKERRFEFADFYREFRQMVSRYNQIGWTAAQTKRDTETQRILSGDKVAEDISKLRKASMGISLGRGDWTEDSIYLWVAKNKFGRQHVGCEIIPDLSRMLIYDREATMRAVREHGAGN